MGMGAHRTKQRFTVIHRFIFLPIGSEDLHWENKEFELKYTRGINLNLESRCTLTGFSFWEMKNKQTKKTQGLHLSAFKNLSHVNLFAPMVLILWIPWHGSVTKQLLYVVFPGNSCRACPENGVLQKTCQLPGLVDPCASNFLLFGSVAHCYQDAAWCLPVLNPRREPSVELWNVLSRESCIVILARACCCLWNFL